ncbi:MAG: ABC transporter ATP-binding protein [Planctomycetota bacterium]|nr:ABC transporter ATP-binding protein [Planctomycetota bacterium]
MMAAILIDSVTKLFGEKIAVDRLSLQIEKGRIFAFLGPNGSGKTTTIKMMVGLMRPTAGRILIGGVDLAADHIAAKRMFAYVPDQPYLYDKLSGTEFLKFVSRMYGLDSASTRAAIEKYVSIFEMGEYIGHLVETYSQGMRQRLTLTSALMRDPEILILDEPLVGLDPHSMRLVKNILRESAAAKKMTVFMSTHLLSIAEETADEIGIILEGKLLARGDFAGLRAQFSEGGNLENVYMKIVDGQAR